MRLHTTQLRIVEIGHRPNGNDSELSLRFAFLQRGRDGSTVEIGNRIQCRAGRRSNADVRIGFGAMIRYGTANITFTDVGTEGATVKAGGVEASAGVRLRLWVL